MGRRTGQYFPVVEGAPPPVAFTVHRRVGFSECDPMGIVWFGRYASFCETASAELGLVCGLSYKDFFEAGLRAPIVTYHVDYVAPLRLDDRIAITASLVWSEAAKLNTQFVIRSPTGAVAATAFTVQLLIDAQTGQVCIALPALLDRCRRRWLAGEFKGQS